MENLESSRPRRSQLAHLVLLVGCVAAFSFAAGRFSSGMDATGTIEVVLGASYACQNTSGKAGVKNKNCDATPPSNVQFSRSSVYSVSVLPVKLSETAEWLVNNHCCSPDDALSQYTMPVVLEQYVRGLRNFDSDYMQADIVLVPMYPVSYGLYSYFRPSRSVEATAEDISKQLLPIIHKLPNSTVLVFVVGHVDGYPIIDRFFLQHIRPRHIVMLRTDMGNTLCRCVGRNFWGTGLENIMVPYSVVQPASFVSMEARRVLSSHAAARNTTLFFNAAPRANSGRDALVASLHAMHRTDLDITLTRNPTINHREYVQRMLSSKFCLVPEGDVSTSLRLFEALVAECVPVITSDCMDLPFKHIGFIGTYSSFAVQLPRKANGTLIMDTVDHLLKSGGYARMFAKLQEVWPYFALHNGSLPQPSAADLIMHEVYAAVERMRSGAPLFSASEAYARTHVC